MKKSSLDDYFRKIDNLFLELNELAPEIDIKKRNIRNEFSGLMVVSLAANYENCVKTILINYADFFHNKFSHQVERKYSYLNSRIKTDSLREYLNHFDGDVAFFQKKIKTYSIKLRNEIDKTYDQILTWRHSYAHANNSITSLDDAYKAHRYAKYVLYAFEDALMGHYKRESLRLIEVFSKNVNKAFEATEKNCETLMEKAEKDSRYQRDFETSWFYFLTAHKLKALCDEKMGKLSCCSITELPNYLSFVKNSAQECQQASKICSQLKKSLPID